MPVVFDAAHRPDSDEFQEQFMQHVNQLSIQEFVKLRKQAEAERTPFATVVSEYKQARDAK